MRERLSGVERRTQIAEVALRLIARDGASALTAAALAGELGLSDAALFRHYTSMEAIVDAAIERFDELLAESLVRPEPQPLDALRGFFVHRLQLVRARPEVLRLAFNDRLADAAGRNGARRVQAMVTRSQAFVRDRLAQAQKAGEVRGDIPVEMLAWAVFGFIRGAALTSLAPPRSAISDVWAALATLILVQEQPEPRPCSPRPRTRSTQPPGAIR
jgi:AcrR family transcriptional regulator